MKKSQQIFLVLFLMIASGAIMAYFANSKGVTKGSKAINFEETSLNNGTINLEDYRGKYVLLDFWGSWCGPCYKEAPYLKKAHDQFNDRVQFIGIAVDNHQEDVQEFIDKFNITWPQIQVPRKHQVPAKLVSQYEINGYPTLFLIDPEGNIIINGNKNSEPLQGKQLISTLESIVNG